MSRYRVVLVTASSEKEAREIGMNLLKDKLAACVNIVPKISSSYWWKGKIETASESLLILKTMASRTAQLIRKVKTLHSYSVPEVIALPILEGNPDYLRWISRSLK
jgi:periplasmic divalent cation tolerance protein